MPSAATVTSVIAIAACAAGGVVALALWRQRAGAARARRLRHPATPPPVAVAVDGEGGVRRWRIDVAEDAPPTAIDIVSWRVRDGSQLWRSEAIVEPIEISPGGWALTPGELPTAGAYDVVVAWTSHTAAGELEGSRTFRVDGRPTPRTGAAPQRVARSPLRWPLIEIAMLLALVAAGVVVLITWGGDERPEAEATTPVPPATGMPALTTTPATVPVPTTMPATTPVPTTPVLTTPVLTTLPATTPVPTTAAATPGTTIAPSAVPTTRPIATTPPTTTTSPTTAGPRVDVAAAIGECRAGPNCLVASFTIDGFDSPQSEYVCEFADGERITFSFGGVGVERACATGSADASITIEVGGVRSATVTRDDAE